MISVSLRSACSTWYVPGQAGATQTISHQPPKDFLARKSTLFWLKQHLRQAPESPQRCGGHMHSHVTLFSLREPCRVSRGQQAPWPFLCSCSTGERDMFHMLKRLNPTPHQRDNWPLLCFCARSRQIVREPLGKRSPVFPHHKKAKEESQAQQLE